ncbi:MAG: hypothetical protein A2Z25_15220 [Planctomycetes bacterium RBG_16_55_9]|nr:MAG: hypothetical protein A2Z25_15220 [Planctomycetes bacterium RBG_16_55_9]
MRQMIMNHKTSKARFACDILLGVLVLAVSTGFGPAAYAITSSGKSQPLPAKKVCINPFSLKKMTVNLPQKVTPPQKANVSQKVSVPQKASVSQKVNVPKKVSVSHKSSLGFSKSGDALRLYDRPPVRIPCRPVLRSPFQPCSVPYYVHHRKPVWRHCAPAKSWS